MNGTFYCNKCGAPNPAEAQFCSRCGASVRPVAAAPVYVTQTGGAPMPIMAGVVPRYGGFWIRVVAAIIDWILIRILIFPIAALFGGIGWIGSMTSPFPHAGMGLHLFGGGITVALAIAGNWLYEAFLLSSSYQATLGKMIFGMRVTDLYGNRISFARATGRHFAKIISGLFFCIGFIMVGFTERKQGLHDMIAGTLVPIR